MLQKKLDPGRISLYGEQVLNKVYSHVRPAAPSSTVITSSAEGWTFRSIWPTNLVDLYGQTVPGETGDIFYFSPAAPVVGRKCGTLIFPTPKYLALPEIPMDDGQCRITPWNWIRTTLFEKSCFLHSVFFVFLSVSRSLDIPQIDVNSMLVTYELTRNMRRILCGHLDVWKTLE